MAAYAVIPGYNEEKHIAEVISRTQKFIPKENIIVVDDGSRDLTAAEALKAGAIVLKHIVNLGKGSALKTGCDYAIKDGATEIILLDSDGQHDPKEIPVFLSLLDGADIIFGYRKMKKSMPAVLKFGNWLIGTTIKILFRINLKDTQCGYRALTAEAYKRIRWSATDYSVESEMIALTGRNRLKYKEKQVETIYLDKYKGTTVMDGVSIVLRMVWWRFTR
jgi:glycosyltransferase involved in cell wall biosynthesis